jgi:hypothetical protein
MANQIQPGGDSGAASKVREGAEQAKEKTLQRTDELREAAISRKDKLGERVGRVGSAMRSAADEVRKEDELVAGYVDRASERFERAANYLKTADPKQAMRDAERFARREPALFFGGAFLLGLAAARFLKSSRHEQESRGERDDSWVPEIGPTSESEFEP